MNRSDLARFFWELGLKFQCRFRMDRKIDLVFPISMILDHIGNFIEYGEARPYDMSQIKVIRRERE